MRVLLLNAGSSSLKATLMDSAEARVIAHAEKQVAARRYAGTVRQVLDELGVRDAPPAAVGHRIVHGGELVGPVLITDEVRTQIGELADLAPLHNPPGLETLAAAEAVLPGVPQVAVFDTAFHRTMPPEAFTYPVPHAWTEEWGIRRYGFHGLSHAYSARRAAELLGRSPEEVSVVICHLGHGCSASAVRGGRSIDTTMGFTPLDGLMMATRSGSVDPGILTYVQQHHGLTATELDEALERRSGLLGVSGISADMREVVAARAAGNPRARLAFDIYVRRVRQAIGALAVTLGTVDALVFTAGVGENSAEVRAGVCDGLDCLGIELDAKANTSRHPDADIARPNARARIFVIAAREDLELLANVVRVMRA